MPRGAGVFRSYTARDDVPISPIELDVDRRTLSMDGILLEPTAMDIQLFLAHADDHRPILHDGVSLETTRDAPAPKAPELATRRFANLSGSSDSLPDQPWAIVAPLGPEGDRLVSLVKPLRVKREEEQGREALVFRVKPEMDAVAAANWIQNEYRDAVGRVDSTRPRYLALLGGPDVISWDFQQMLGGEAFVGRIAFGADTQYEAYVNKVVRWASESEISKSSALFHSVLDGSRATQEGHKHLVVPSLEWARAALKNGTFDAENIIDVPMSSIGSPLDPTTAAGALLRESAQTRAGLLFTMSHGAGIPKTGWTSAAEQREIQGAMVLGRRGNLLTANDIMHSPFLAGGVWFMFACYGAGTPSRSAYFPWLERLHALGFLGKSADNVLAALPRAGDPPFVAALPQAALANPDGPLGFVGHVDLAWSWSFQDYDVAPTGFAAKNRADRFQSILQAFAHGHRFGVAHHELVKYFRSINGDLTASYIALEQQKHGSPEFVEDRATQIRRANLWMQRQDLSAYVLLGDPAARLPISRCPSGIGLLPQAAADDRVDAVLAILRGTETQKDAVKRLGISRDEIERWVEVFVEGGRAALAKKR